MECEPGWLPDPSFIYRMSWTWLPLDNIKDLPSLERALTIPNGAYYASVKAGYPTDDDPDFLCYVYHNGGGYIGVPRNFEYRSFLVDPNVPVTSPACPSGRYDFWRHRIVLREGQRPAVDALTHGEDKILSLACGRGKSVIALCALCEQAASRLPALIIVHTQVLMEQWVKMIRTHLNVGLAKIGRIQGKVCSYQGCPFTIAMLQSLTQKEYPGEMLRYFNTVVFDEAHRVSAPQFSKAAPMFLGQRWGLSATPTRKDGNDRVFRLHCGLVVYTDLRQDLTPVVYFIETGLRVDLSRYRMWRDPTKINFAKLVNTISYDDERNNLVHSYVRGAINKDRTVLVLGERVEQLLSLAQQYPDVAAPLVGPMKAAERAEAIRKQVVFATAALAKEGLDRPAFDTLLVLVPSTNPAWLQQAFGRILRSCKDKQQPTVLIFEDAEVDPMRRRCDKIRYWLRQQKMEGKTVRRGVQHG